MEFEVRNNSQSSNGRLLWVKPIAVGSRTDFHLVSGRFSAQGRAGSCFEVGSFAYKHVFKLSLRYVMRSSGTSENERKAIVTLDRA